MWIKCSLNFHCYQFLSSLFYFKQYVAAKFTLIHFVKGGMCYKFR